MWELTGPSRRLFGQSLGALLALTILPKSVNAQKATFEVKIRKFAFEPGSVTVAPGTSVRWINGDSAPHTATSTDKKWDTGKLEKLQVGSITFEQPGTFEYYCVYHPHMKGQIVVE